MFVVALNLALTLFTALITLRNFPNSGDEYAYLISAQLFSEGRLSVPSPEPREFFHVFHVVNNGQFYGKYPPGWPLILSLGVLVNAPWLVNPILGLLTLLLMHKLARQHFSDDVANAALYAAAVNPFLIFTNASYFAHPACLLFVTLFMYAALWSLREPARRLPYLLMGVALGAAFTIRPYTALAVAFPFGVWFVINSLHTGEWWRRVRLLVIAAGPFALACIVFLVYNDRQTGHPLLQPFMTYNPRDVPFGLTFDWREVLRLNASRVLYELNRWIPLSVVLVLLLFVSRKARRHLPAVLLLAGAVSVCIAYALYPGNAGNRYGPRYLYEASSALFILVGAAIVRWRRFALAILLVITAINVYVLARSTVHYGVQVRERMEVYDLVKQQRLSQAIVFLRTGTRTMDPPDLTRNGIRFDGDVLYVHDLGARNAELLRAFPGRTAYVYEHDRVTRSGRLTPYAR